MTDKLHKIGFCATNLYQEPQSFFLKMIAESAEQKNYHLLIFTAFTEFFDMDSNDIGAAGVFSIINYKELDAMIIVPDSFRNDELVESIIDGCTRAGVPVVLINSEHKGCFSICYDYLSSFETICRHVIEKHECKTLNLLAGIRGQAFSEARVDVFRRLLKEYNLECDERRIDYGDFWEAPANEAIKRFMKTNLSLPDAYICCNDSMAITLCSMLHNYGFKIPRDVIVTGFDGIAMERFQSPRLTTATNESPFFGQIVMSVIDKAMVGAEPYQTMISCTINYSESCGCEPIGQPENVMGYVRNINYHQDYERYMASMTTALTLEPTVKRMPSVVAHYVNTGFWICLNKDFAIYQNEDITNTVGRDTSRETLADEMKVQLRKYVDGRYESGMVFPTSQMLPNLDEVLKDVPYLVFFAVNFQSNCYGYCAFEGISMSHDIQNLPNFSVHLNHSLETIRGHERLQAANRQLERLYLIDPMLEILNRRGFYRALERKLAEKSGDNIVVLGIDLDGLKRINDFHGHNEGDCAIGTVAEALKAAVINGEICSRFGGDEFTVAFVAGADAQAKAEAFIKRINDYLSDYNASSGKHYRVVISCGTAIAPLDESFDLEETIRLADARMYIEKAQHYNRK